MGREEEEEIEESEEEEDYDEESDEEPTPFKYSSTYPQLPATSPPGHQHIISGSFDEDTDKTNLRAADGVATFLYKWKPEILTKFLDPATSKLEIVLRRHSDVFQDLVIAKHGSSVMCEFLRDGEMRTQLLFEICADGKWKPISGSVEGLVARGSMKEEHMDKFGSDFAKAILYHNMWGFGDGEEVKVSRG